MPELSFYTVELVFGSTYIVNQLRFWKYSPIFLFLIWPHFGPLLHFLALRGYFWDWGQIQKIYGTHLCRQSTLVLEVQSYLFAFTLSKFGAFFALFGFLGAIFGVDVRFKNIFGTYLCRLSIFVLEV